MEPKDLLIKFKEDYDIKDHKYNLIKIDCEYCLFPNEKICVYNRHHSIYYEFDCNICNSDLVFYENKNEYYSRIYNGYDSDDIEFDMSCKDTIIRSIIT